MEAIAAHIIITETNAESAKRCCLAGNQSGLWITSLDDRAVRAKYLNVCGVARFMAVRAMLIALIFCARGHNHAGTGAQHVFNRLTNDIQDGFGWPVRARRPHAVVNLS